MSKPIAYVFLDRCRDWECFVTLDPREADDDEDLYLAGTVSSLNELHELMDDNGFDSEYFYEYINLCLPHRLYNLLDKEDR